MPAHQTIHLSPRQYALITGWTLLCMALLAGFSYGYVFSNLFVNDNATANATATNAAATAANIRASEGLFRGGILGFVGVLVLDIVAAWSLYYVLQPVSKSLSLLAAWLRLAYTAVFGVAFLNLIIVTQLTNNTIYLGTLGAEPLTAHTMLFVNSFQAMWSLSLIVFAIHLLFVGFLVMKSGFMPKWLGLLVIFAGLCYLVNDSANLLFAEYVVLKPRVEQFIAAPMALGELALAIWLLARGGKERVE
jgi:hypothetical protein